MFSKVTMFATLALAMGLASAAPPPTVHFGNAVPYIPSGLSACNTTSNPNEFLAGVSQHIFDTFGGASGAICGRFIRVQNNDGKFVTVKVDNSGGGPDEGDLILSHPAYTKLGPLNVVPVFVSWSVVPL